jgi:hypothetical protein
MKTQLLMIIAVVLSSLLTVTQRANAQEVSQLRWLEPTLDQRFNEVVAPDQELGSDNGYIVPSSSTLKASNTSSSKHLFYYYFPNANKINGSINPRAPPFSLI